MSRFSIPDNVKPSSFAEGQRLIFGCLVSCAGVAHFAFAAALVSIFVWGGWPADQYASIIEWLGFGLLLLLAIDGLVVISLSLGGPVGRMRLKASRDGIEGEASGDGEPVITPVVTPAPAQPYVPPPGPPSDPEWKG